MRIRGEEVTRERKRVRNKEQETNERNGRTRRSLFTITEEE